MCNTKKLQAIVKLISNGLKFGLFSKKINMADNKTKTGEPDRSLVNTNEDHEVKYWSTKFGVSAGELIDAVKEVGNSALKVEEYLGKKSSSKKHR